MDFLLSVFKLYWSYIENILKLAFSELSLNA